MLVNLYTQVSYGLGYILVVGTTLTIFRITNMFVDFKFNILKIIKLDCKLQPHDANPLFCGP